MTQIVLTDDALVRLLAGCDFPGVTVMSAPHEWDDGFVQSLLTAAPALLVAFLGAGDTADATELNMDGRWAVYVVTGWNGRDQKARRLGAGAGFDLFHRTSSVLHNAILREENGARLPIVKVTGLDVLTDSAHDVSNLWIGAIELLIELPLPLLESESCYGPLDDFLRARGPLDLPDPAADVDIAVDLPQ